ncbi:protein PTM1 [Infundibulicybe gibba]|nr:protein PTM1 [Infundibulicybe gibba]
MVTAPWPLALVYVWFLCAISSLAYEVSVEDTDYSRQICSGMWASKSTYINVTFDAASQGQLAMVIYEWADSAYLGKVTDPSNDYLPKTYVCTSSAVSGGFWSARVELPANKALPTNGLWDNPEGNPTPPSDNFTSPWRRGTNAIRLASPDGIYKYQSPIHYLVEKTGYYCVGFLEEANPYGCSLPSIISWFSLFPEYFQWQATRDRLPKVNFYFAMFLVYAAFGGAWGWLCYQHIHELLPIQYYLSSLVGLLTIEMVANWGYYRYLNAHGKSTASTVFLIVVAILDAGRNSMSFFMLLVVSLGAHFLFGILYAVGIVELELESTSALVLLLFVIPLAFTLSGFLIWIMHSLNSTITQLRARKQRYKLGMFERLHRILLFTVLIIAIFFVVSSLSFSGRLAEDYAAKSWKYRWWLLDGWLALLYFVAFAAIAYLWRPTANNRR